MSIPLSFHDARAQLLSALDSRPGPRRLKQILARAVATGLLRDPFVSARAVAAAAPSDTPLAHLAFRAASPRPSAFAFAALIRAHSAGPSPALALRLFSDMLRAGLYPDSFSFPFLLRASARLHVDPSPAHAIVLRHGLAPHPHVSTSLLRSYATLGLLDAARRVFDETPQRTTVTWNAIISCHAKAASHERGLSLFVDMLTHGEAQPNSDTFAGAIACCAGVGALAHGRAAQALATRRLGGRPAEVGTGLVHMYAKCGSLEAAWKLFDAMHDVRDASTWTAMIGGLAMHGRGEEAVALFERMVGEEGVAPDGLAFTNVLHACSHSGLVEVGIRLFKEMKELYGIKPRMEHYGTMVDLFGRAGRLEAALRVLESMPFKPNQVVWGSLLHACAINGELGFGERLEKRLLGLGLELGMVEGEEGGFFVGVSNLYARGGKWDEVGRVRDRMVERGVRKESAISLVVVNGEVHKFLVGDTKHPLGMEIHRMLYEITREIMSER
ncbi:putative pentatricopeptide repeat-containing protein At5g40405 [Phoenix dactylifera]|uniref:Pentatricopeptide repeat-containing protein At5g40405 n=1 Tax=Phoenix dactylifera TaxID=42345 RepID=A0A8B9AG47_PHODC|nr:putative pentatricopeptide repeat-containing protein At5g40405 [Phoenix dactylifera]